MNQDINQVDAILLALQKIEGGLYTLQRAFYGERVETNETSPWDEYSHVIDALLDQVKTIETIIED